MDAYPFFLCLLVAYELEIPSRFFLGLKLPFFLCTSHVMALN